MKYLLIILILVGCSKSDPKPVAPTSVKDFIGHYTGSWANPSISSATLSLDITISKSGATYSVTGSYNVTGNTKQITQSLVLAAVLGQRDWELFLNNTGLVVVVGISTDYNTVNADVDTSSKDLPGGAGGFVLTRK